MVTLAAAMMNARRGRPNEDVVERRRREDESPRLSAIVPDLQGLRLELSEARGQGQVEVEHIRRVSVENAPSVFVLPCGEPRCKHGSYDLTHQLMSGLRRGEKRIEASDTCTGDVGTAQCGRVLKCIAIAEYRAT
jgi:hypothetical protein